MARHWTKKKSSVTSFKNSFFYNIISCQDTCHCPFYAVARFSTNLDLQNVKLARYSYWCWRCPSPSTRAESEHLPLPHLCHITWLTYTPPPSLIHTHTSQKSLPTHLTNSEGQDEEQRGWRNKNIGWNKRLVQISVGQRGEGGVWIQYQIIEKKRKKSKWWRDVERC